MYSFAQNEAIRVVDEPLYGHYLRVSGADHPGREDILAAMNCDGDAVMADLLAEQATMGSDLLFIKHMAHHLVDLNLGFLNGTRNIFLIRDPREMLPSLTVQLPHAALQDTGLQQQWELYDNLVAADRNTAILDSKELLLDPEGVLRILCEQIGVTLTPEMLHWPAGPRPEDGVWAPHWYHAVHQSTGYAPYTPKDRFPEHLRTLLDECQPWYDRLFEHAIRATT